VWDVAEDEVDDQLGGVSALQWQVLQQVSFKVDHAQQMLLVP